MSENSKDIHAIIMGGGPAGLAAGKVLTDGEVKATVLEKDDGVGGLSRTISHNGFLFDLGGHRFFTKKAELDKFLHDLMVDQLINVDRSSKIYFRGKYFNYPPTFLNAFAGLGPIMSARILGSFIIDKYKYRNMKAVTIEDWMIQQFGRRMYEIFFKYYTEKVWGVNCDQASAVWAAQRIKGMSLLGTIKEAILPSKAEKPVSLIGQFKYPEHGIGRISDRLAQEIQKSNEIKLNARVAGILHKEGRINGVRVQYADGREEVLEGSHVLSSIPVTELIMILDPPAPESVREAAQKLRYRDLLIVTIMFDAERVTNDSWIYFPDPEISFGRLHEPTNWSAAMSPPGKTSLVFEYFCFETDPIWSMDDSALVEKTLKELDRIKLAPGKVKLAFDHCVVRARKAYPIHEIGHEEPLDKIKSFLEQFENLILMGRYGQFVYNNLDHSIETGIHAAKMIIGESTEAAPVIEDEYLEMKYNKTKLEACCLCDGADYSLYLKNAYLLKETTYDLVRCDGCGLVRVDPMPKTETLKSMYTEKYFDQDFSCGARKGTYLESEAMRVEEYREILSRIKSFKPEGRLLEIGCAAGSFLNYGKRAGYEVEGVDVSKWAADMAREQFDVKVRVGRLIEIGYDDDAFDVIFMGDLLEHEPHPLELLEETKRILKPGGVVAIKVPTYVNSFYYRLARLLPLSWFFAHMDLRLLHAMKLSHQTPSFPPYHVYEYSHDLLSGLCEKAGLDVIGHHTSLLVPEFLHGWRASRMDRMVYLGFMALRKLVVQLNLPAGHVMVFAAKGK